MSVAKRFTLTHSEYLELEEGGQVRHEYVRGCVFAMVGASHAHNQIALNIAALLHAYLKGTGCFAYISDMKVRIEASDSYYYPDVMVTCESVDAKMLYSTKPVLIVEVLSPSTTDIDRREKLAAYGLLTSLVEYMVVHQDKRKVALHRKTESGSWSAIALEDIAVVTLTAMPTGEFLLPLDEIYAGVLD